MAISYQSKDDAVQSVQLKVQEVCVRLSDTSVVASSGSTITIDFKETVADIRSATFLDDSAGTNAPITAANQSTTGTATTFTLSAPMAAADSVTVKYVVAE